MSFGRFPCLALTALVACSTFGTSTNDPPSPNPPLTADGYNPAAEIACDNVGVCHPPQFCCFRGVGKNTCEESGCKMSDDARIRCSDFSACAPGLFCCLRLSSFHVTSITCEADCPKSGGGSGVFQLCGDGDANARCSGACVPLNKLSGGGINPGISLRACE